MGKYDSFKAQHPKRGYRKEQIKSWSHYNDSIDRTEGRPCGNSRRWGDASSNVQEKVIQTVIDSCKRHELNTADTARVLAIIRAESGFNPDAASNESACGIGQLLNRTRKQYKVKDDAKFDLSVNAEATVHYYMDCKKKADFKNLTGTERDELIYKYYGDGLYSDGKDSGAVKNFSKPDGVYEWTEKIEKTLTLYEKPGLKHGTENDPGLLACNYLESEDEDYYYGPGMTMA